MGEQPAHARGFSLFSAAIRPHPAPAGALVSGRFTQLEVNRKSIVYIIQPDNQALEDSLDFQVSDVLGNTGPSHR